MVCPEFTALLRSALAAGLPGDWAATVWLMHGCGLIGEALPVSTGCRAGDGTVVGVSEQVNLRGQRCRYRVAVVAILTGSRRPARARASAG